MGDCKKCKHNILGGDERIVCGGTCRKPYHLACAGVSRSLYQGIKSIGNIVWYCNECLDLLVKLNEKVSLIFDHLLAHDEKFTENMKKMEEDLKNGIDAVKASSSNEKGITYAEKVKLSKNEPVVIIKPKDDKKTGKETRMDVRKNIDPSVIPVKEMRNAAHGSVVLECKNAASTEQVRQEVEEKMGQDYNVSVASLRNPEIKVIGLYDKPEKEEIVEKIKRQNDFILTGANIEVLRVEEAKRRGDSYNIVLSVDPSTYNLVMDAGKLNVGWSRCRVVENIRILRCFRCAEYGHKVGECKNKETCFKCSGEHRSDACDSITSKCTNCERAKNRLGLTDIRTDHPVWSNECQVYNRILEKRKKTINYYG